MAARIEPDERWQKWSEYGEAVWSTWSVYHNRSCRRNVNDGGGIIGKARQGRVLLIQTTQIGEAVVTGSMAEWLTRREAERTSLRARGYAPVILGQEG